MSASARKVLLLLLALGLLVGVSFVQQSLNRDRDRLDLTRVQHLENAPPVLAFTTMALGVSRSHLQRALDARQRPPGRG